MYVCVLQNKVISYVSFSRFVFMLYILDIFPSPYIYIYVIILLDI